MANRKQQQQRRRSTRRTRVAPVTLLTNHVIKPPNDPPEVRSDVWYNRIIRNRVTVAAATPSVIQVSDLGITGAYIQLLSVRVWSAPGAGLLTVDFYDPAVVTAPPTLQRLTDEGSYTIRPAVGYHYGERISSTMLYATDPNNIIKITVDADISVIVDVSVRFKMPIL